ncbi:hypothetical protein GGR51DRAFT_246042 [Nemania sp. FL0031]|nr:hypothetical protein GGR51DRAFT_246042 [Nemania sp. FL0031]
MIDILPKASKPPTVPASRAELPLAYSYLAFLLGYLCPLVCQAGNLYAYAIGYTSLPRWLGTTYVYRETHTYICLKPAKAPFFFPSFVSPDLSICKCHKCHTT